MAWLVIGLVAFFVLLWIWDEHQDAKRQVHMGNHWQYWRAEAEARWEPTHRHYGAWNPSAQDRGPTGRVDVTPGGRVDR